MPYNLTTLENGCRELGIELSQKQKNQFIQFYEFLVEKNKVMNLTGITEFEEVLTKHFLDSLACVKAIDMTKVKTIMDIGTGAGFPGVPLKIAFPHLEACLLDSLKKRVNFLEESFELLGLEGIKAIHGRAEEYAKNKEYREKYDLCVSRAVSNLATLSEYCLPYVKTGGTFMFEKIFHLKENHTDVKTEIMAGITTFMTMAYILAVNPSILSASGMDANAVLIATSLASFVGTALMALLANYPFALAPGMGLNAYFAYTVVLTMGYSWQLALMAVFVEGIIFIVLSLTNVREAIFNAIPMTLKSAVSVGIGLFVAFVGLQNAKLIVNSDSTLVTYQHFKGETFSSVGVGAILALLGVAITAILLVKHVKGGILYGILITWVLGIVCELTGIYIPNPDAGMYSVIPTSFVSFDFSALGKTFGQVFKTDFSGVGILNFFAVMFSFLFVDLFDTLGTLIGVASKADMLDEDGKLPHIKGALMADSIATCAGAVLGTSTTTTFVESASGVTEGGRTGLTSMTTGVLFLLAVVFSPLFLTIPSFATAPALIIVGFYMMGSAVKIDFSEPSEGIPAFLTILAMPTAYSISEGIAIGVISWTIINVVTGKAKEKKISPLMYVLTILFILKYVLL